MTKGCWRNFARWSLIGCQTKENTVSNTCTLSVPRIKHSSSCDATKVDKTLSFLLIDPPRQTELRSSPNMFALHTLAGLQADLVRRDLTNWYGLCTNLFLTSSWFMSVYMYISIYIYIFVCIYVFICIYVNINICIYIYKYIYVYIHMQFRIPHK